MYRIHVSVIQAQGQCHTFMPSLEGYSFNSGYILTQVKENAQNTCPWPFIDQSWGQCLLLSATKDMHGCLAILCPFKQYFSHDMIMDGWMAKKLCAIS